MELFAGFGLFSKELFQYNRENYQFDQSQRLDRELMRLEMQIKRFELFREDIRDLVELCVGRMEMYHLVGAMFLEFCVALYCEGRLRQRAPPFLLGLFYMSTASAFVYLVLAVWLSMHASICAHSFGVRLLTRYVRLPIPSIAQMGALNARLADFERQGGAMMRVPFVGNLQGRDQKWLQRAPGPEAASRPGSSGDGSAPMSRQVSGPGGPAVPNQALRRDLLGTGEQALLNEQAMMEEVPSSKLPGKHIMLFRRLQCKWQCYDAYARVCMSLGCNMILQSICYYLINITLLEYEAKSCCMALMVTFQLAALVVAYIDVARIGKLNVILMQAPAMIPCFMSAGSIMVAMSGVSAEELSPTRKYPSGPACFILIVLWFEGLLRLAWPSQDEATLPRRFRAVLFLDVFEEASLDPTTAEVDDGFVAAGKKSRKDQVEEEELRRNLAERAGAADEALHLAHCALRRWEAVPAGLSMLQQRRLTSLRQQHGVARDAINGEAARLAARQGLKDAASLLDDDRRPWDDLSEREQAEDPCTGMLLGPFQHQARFGASSYHFDLERQDFVWQVGDDQRVLSLDEVEEMVIGAERQVRQVLSSGPGHASSDEGTSESVDHTSSDEDASKRLRRSKSGTARLVSNAVGKQENPLVPVRLPWTVMKGTTRVVQFAWFFVFVMLLAEVIEPFHFDAQVYLEEHEEEGEGHGEEHGEHGGHGEHAVEGREHGSEHGAEEARGEGQQGHEAAEEHHGGEGVEAHGAWPVLPEPTPGFSVWPAKEGRRLSAWSGWRWRGLRARLPLGQLLRPERLSCLPQASAFLLGTPYESYEVSYNSSSALDAFHAAPLPRSLYPPGTAALCAAGAAGCLLGAPVPGGLELWPMGGGREDARKLSLEPPAKPWRRLAGAALPCRRLARLLEDQTSAEWCLLMAGWDGERLPVAVVPLPQGPGRPPVSGSVVPSFDAPLKLLQGQPGARSARAAGGGSKEIVALHLEPSEGRLWALLQGGALQAWQLPALRTLGRWTPDWPAADKSFAASALCEAPGRRLLLAGKGAEEGPRLLYTELPRMVTAPRTKAG